MFNLFTPRLKLLIQQRGKISKQEEIKRAANTQQRKFKRSLGGLRHGEISKRSLKDLTAIVTDVGPVLYYRQAAVG